MEATISVRDAVGRQRVLYRISKERWLLLESLIFVPFLPQDNSYLDDERLVVDTVSQPCNLDC